jgi:S1-C subfamily serine protease
VARVTPSVVQVLAGETRGSGVTLTNGVLTNQHVVREARHVRLVTQSGKQVSARVEKVDNARDLAFDY